MSDLASLLIFQTDIHLLILAICHLLEAETTILESIYHHISQTSGKSNLTFCVSHIICNTVELRIVVYLEIHPCILHRFTLCIHNPHCQTCRSRSIMLDDIDLCI